MPFKFFNNSFGSGKKKLGGGWESLVPPSSAPSVTLDPDSHLIGNWSTGSSRRPMWGCYSDDYSGSSSGHHRYGFGNYEYDSRQCMADLSNWPTDVDAVENSGTPGIYSTWSICNYKDGKFLQAGVSGDTGYPIAIWEVGNGNPYSINNTTIIEGTRAGGSWGAADVNVTPDGNWMVSKSNEHKIWFGTYDDSSFTLQGTYTTNTSNVRAIGLDPVTGYFWFGTDDGNAGVFVLQHNGTSVTLIDSIQLSGSAGAIALTGNRTTGVYNNLSLLCVRAPDPNQADTRFKVVKLEGGVLSETYTSETNLGFFGILDQVRHPDDPYLILAINGYSGGGAYDTLAAKWFWIGDGSIHELGDVSAISDVMATLHSRAWAMGNSNGNGCVLMGTNYITASSYGRTRTWTVGGLS